MTPIEMHEHVLSICAAHDIGVVWCRRPGHSYALHEFEEIVIAPIKSAVSYAVALHEIGHVLGTYQRSKRVLVRERRAWRWARENARVWTPAMERCARRSFEWYVPRAKRIDMRQADH